MAVMWVTALVVAFGPGAVILRLKAVGAVSAVRLVIVRLIELRFRLVAMQIRWLCQLRQSLIVCAWLFACRFVAVALSAWQGWKSQYFVALFPPLLRFRPPSVTVAVWHVGLRGFVARFAVAKRK